MRKVTNQAVNAFVNKQNFKNANTQVIVNGKNVEYRLYGHLIAERVGDKRLYVDNCGYFTNTTKERLNGLPGVSIQQVKGKWYLNDKEWDGTRTCINSDYKFLLNN